MSVARHRIAASAVLLCASLGVVAVGRTLVEDTPAVARVRSQLEGKWVATRVEATAHNSAAGAAAAATTVEFAGRDVQFHGLIEAGATQGVYNINPSTQPGKIDFKVDAGWMLGAYSLDGDRLTICVNALRLLEQLGVPGRGRPESLRMSPGRYLYEFRKATP